MTERQSRLLYPIVAGAALLGLHWFLSLKPSPGLLALFGDDLRGLRFVAYVPLIFAAVRLFDLLVFDLVARRRGGVSAPRLLRDIIALTLYFVLFSWTSYVVLEFEIGRWLTTAAVLGAILGLALQETLGNLFSGIALHMEDSFELGDVIKSGDHIGVVEGVTWRATKLRAFSGNNLVILPNSLLARERLEVFPRHNLNSRVVQVGVDYSTPPAVVIPVLTQAAAHVDGVSREIPCFARVASFGDSAMTYDIKYFTREYHRRDQIDADVKKAVWYALRRNAISIPFPIRSFQRYKPPEHEDHLLTPDQVREHLDQVDILTPLSGDARQALAVAAEVHFYSRGETIIASGTSGDSMFVVYEGTVSVAAEHQEVAQLGAGDVFGEMALLTGEHRTADVVALTDVTAIEISKDALQPIIKDQPDLAATITRRVMERRARLSELQAEEVEEEERTIRTRILSYFGLR